MKQTDDFSSYYADLLDGRYDCVDRIVLNGYFPLGQQGGDFRTWWRRLFGDATLDQEHLQRMAGQFSRRVHAWANKHGVPVVHCKPKQDKHGLAQKYMPHDPSQRGLFLILVGKAPGLVWEVKKAKNGVGHLQRKTPWPYVNHYHFHLMDPEWGHIVIKMSGHPPFGVQVMLNGHEWVERQALKQTDSITIQKEGNCFVGGSFQALDEIADTLCHQDAVGRLTQACDRWIYTSCLCFGLDLDEQRRSGFRYRYSCYQLEYSRNLLFIRGTTLDAVYQGLIERTRQFLDVRTLRTIFGYKYRPHHRKRAFRIERVVEQPAYDLRVFKVHFGPLTLKIYDKGARVLRMEAIAHNVKGLRCGRSVEKLSLMLAELQRMVIDFLNTVQAAHKSYLPDGSLDALLEPTHRGQRRLAGVDLQKCRMRAASETVLALAPKPHGFTVAKFASTLSHFLPQATFPYTARHASYDLMKLRGKDLVERVGKTQRYRIHPAGIRTLAGLLIVREKVIKPVLAGAAKPGTNPSPKNIHPLDQHYLNLQLEMHRTFQTLGLAA